MNFWNAQLIDMYMPVLKWRQGEYLALDRLEESVKDQVIPLVEIPPIEWDFEKGRLAKTIDQHLEPFSRRVQKKWGQRPIVLDMLLVAEHQSTADGRHPVQYVFDEIRKWGGAAVPVTGLGRGEHYQAAVADTISTDNKGACVRLSFDDLGKADARLKLKALCDQLQLAVRDMDLVVDLGAPNFFPVNVFAAALRRAINRIEQVTHARSFTLVATSFPKTMGGLNKGIQMLDRTEWTLYRRYCAGLDESARVPRFGDYAIAHPVLPGLDMRLLKPAASLRYTIDDGWLICKGENVRDHGFGQYVQICRDVCTSPHFCGAEYSAGDRYIYECSKRQQSTGQLTTWRWVGTNHHITKIVTDLASAS